MSEQALSPSPARVALLVTCLVDLFRPSVGFAAVKLLEQAGCTVEVPRAQTCCGQPAYNSGDRADAKAIARQIIAAFAGYDYVVAPSGSCAGMVKAHYPELFAGDIGCRLNIAGKLSRLGHAVEARHVAEVLADMTDTPPIGGAPLTRHSRESGNPEPRSTVARSGPPLSRG